MQINIFTCQDIILLDKKIKMYPNTVHCDITGVDHKVVTTNQNVDEFLEWVQTMISEMCQGKVRCVSMDCEGFNLGAIPNSLGLIQIAQCYADDVFDKDVETPIPLNIRPGFMIKIPNCQEVYDGLSALLTQDNLKIICFDFICDFASMAEIGIKINYNNAFDTQTFGCKGTYFPNRSLKEVCESGNLCAEYDLCMDAIKNKHSIDFARFTWEYHNEIAPFEKMLTEEFWNYSSHDIVLTALAGLSAITKYGADNVIEYSKKKAEKFVEMQRKYGVLSPSIAKNASFAAKHVDQMKRTNSMKFAFSNFNRAWVLATGYDLMDPETKKLIKYPKEYFITCYETANAFILENKDKTK